MTKGRLCHVPAFFGHSKGPSLEPQSHYYIICCTVVAIWNYLWSFTIGFVASEPSSEQGRRKHTWNNLFTWSPTPSSPTVIYLLAKPRRDIADDIIAGLFILFDGDSEPDDHSEVLPLFVGCIVNFIVSYLICMFQDSVPAGSYNDPFLSSVCRCACACPHRQRLSNHRAVRLVGVIFAILTWMVSHRLSLFLRIDVDEAGSC